MSIFRRLNPLLVPTSCLERARASIGALVGIIVTGLTSSLALGADVNLPLLIAPMGASAVLLFAAPTSPLAQPWSILGGNVVAAFVGVTCALLIQQPLVAACVAVGVAIAVMLVLNCLHPPSGAVALTAVLGGAAIHKAGYWFVLSPVALNSLIILAVALLYNNLTGHRYPHLAPKAVTPKPGATDNSAASGIADIEAALADYDEVVPVSPDELDRLFRSASHHAIERHAGSVTCRDIMSSEVLAVRTDSDLRSAWRIFVTSHHRALPVVDEDNHLKGVISWMDFLDNSVLSEDGTLQLGLGKKTIARLKGQPLPKRVEDLMHRDVVSASLSTPVDALWSMMVQRRFDHMPVVDAASKLVGIVSQSDVLAALFRMRAEMAEAS